MQYGSLLFLLLTSPVSFAMTEAELDERYLTNSTSGEVLQLFQHKGKHVEPYKQKDLRKGVEIEVTKRLSCSDEDYTPLDLYEILRGGYDDAYAFFRDLNTCKRCESFATSFPFNEVPWDEESHRLREQFPYIWLSIEEKRFAPLRDGKRTLIQGRDLMDDFYFDTDDFIAFDQGYTIRGRRRWQNWSPFADPSIQRLLVAFKQTKGINPQTNEPVGIDPETGLKTARKVDDRTRANKPPSIEHAAGIVDDVRSGTAPWVKRGSDEKRAPLESIARLYEDFVAKGVLPTIGKYEDVLALDAQAFVRSLRGRYHLIEIPLVRLEEIYRSAEFNLEELRDTLKDETVELGGDWKTEIDAIRNLIKDTLSGKALYDRVHEKLSEIDPKFGESEHAVSELRSYQIDRSKESFKKLKARKLVAEAYSELLHEIANRSRPILIATLDEDHGKLKELENVNDFWAWQNSFPAAFFLGLPRLQDYRVLNSVYKKITSLDQREAARDQFNIWVDARNKELEQYGKSERHSRMKKGEFKYLKKQLHYQKYMVQLRQVEASGTAALGLWFDIAREFFVPKSRRVDESSEFDHLLIDTFDFAAIYSGYAWKDLHPTEETNQREPSIEELLTVVVVNEVQIELGKEAPFVDRIVELKKALSEEDANVSTESTPELSQKQELDGVQMVFNSYLQAMQKIADMKGAELLPKLAANPLNTCSEWKWENASASKGEIAIEAVKEKAE